MLPHKYEQRDLLFQSSALKSSLKKKPTLFAFHGPCKALKRAIHFLNSCKSVRWKMSHTNREDNASWDSRPKQSMLNHFALEILHPQRKLFLESNNSSFIDVLPPWAIFNTLSSDTSKLANDPYSMTMRSPSTLVLRVEAKLPMDCVRMGYQGAGRNSHLWMTMFLALLINHFH